MLVTLIDFLLHLTSFMPSSLTSNQYGSPPQALIFPVPLYQKPIVEQWHASQHHLASQPAELPIANSTRPFWMYPSDTMSSNETYEEVSPLAKEGSKGDLTSEADVCIIGSGISGVGVAYHLSKLAPEKNVVILEARDFCSGATGRNGGHLTPAHFQDFNVHLPVMGPIEAKKQYYLEQHTAKSIVSIIEANNWVDDVDLVSGGHIQMLVTKEEVEEARANYAAAAESGLNVDAVEWISEGEMHEFSGASFPGFFHPAHNLWPLKLVTRLYQVASSAFHGSLTLHTNTPVTSISASNSDSSDSWLLTTPRGEIKCRKVVHTTNAYASHLLPHLAGPKGIVPVRAQIIATRGASQLSSRARASWGGNTHFEYWFPRPPKVPSDTNAPLIIIGGGRECCPPEDGKPGFEVGITDDSTVNENVGKALRAFLPKVFPGMYEDGREPEMEWTGILGYTDNNDPFVGPLHDAQGKEVEGQYISAGFSGHGMPRAFGCAEVLAGIIYADMNRAGKDNRPVPEWVPQRYMTWNRV